MKKVKKPTTEFNFIEGREITAKYKIIEKVGDGWEGEVYKVKEIHSGIERAAKFFSPKEI